MSWGPTHQTRRQRNAWKPRAVVLVIWFIAWAGYPNKNVRSVIFAGGILLAIIWTAVVTARRRGWANRPLLRHHHRHAAATPVGAGVHLGLDKEGLPRRSPAEHAVLILGPPRSGKTSSVIIPTLLAYPGPVVSTSTKPDVMTATRAVRGRDGGRVWQFDPTATSRPTEGVEVLRWSPVMCASEWDGGLLMARAMVTGAHVGTGTTDASHWTRRAQALLAPLLHAAAVGGKSITDVVDWVARHEIDEPGALLSENGGARLAVGNLVGLRNTEARERSSIFSAAADALDAYTSQAALNAAEEPNFFAGRFVTSRDTIYIHAPAEHQQIAAPLVCGLLAEIRRATYAHHRDGTLRRPVLFALDEVANIAPITELPQIASEGASQGILLLAALQDLSQARARWGTAADGFLTLFGTKLILPGIADQKTLESVSIALGEYDRRIRTTNVPNTTPFTGLLNRNYQRPHSTTSYSTQRQRRVPPGDVARIPNGNALHLHGVLFELVTLTPAHAQEPWRSLTQTPA